MPMSFKEPPIPEVEVVTSCPQGGEDFHSLSDPRAWGDHETCVAYIVAHRPPQGTKFALRYINSGHLASFSVPHNHGWKV